MKLRHLLLLFISFFFVLPLYAEYFKHIGLSEGLTQPSVMAIYQDRLGRMWFGTKEGISQYDGNRVRIFKGWIKSVGEEPPVWLGNGLPSLIAFSRLLAERWPQGARNPDQQSAGGLSDEPTH